MKTLVVIAMLVRSAYAQPDPSTESPARPEPSAPPVESPRPAPVDVAPAEPELQPPSMVLAVPRAELDITPPLEPGRLFGEAAVGLAAGATAALVGGLIGYKLECSGGCGGEFGGIVGGLVGASIAAPIGMGIGVWAIGSVGDQRGSLGWTIAGSFGGAVVGVLAGAAIENATHNQSGDDFATVAALTGWVGGALIGFNATRSRDASPTVLVPIITSSHDVTYAGLGGRF